MFNNDKSSMKEMLEASSMKNNYERVLASFTILNDEMKLSEVEELFYFWKEFVKNTITLKDAATEINDGNIFILLHKTSKKEFDKKMNNFMMKSMDGKEGIRSSILYLTNEEAEFILNLHS